MDNQNITTEKNNTSNTLKNEFASNHVQLIGNLGKKPVCKELTNNNYLTKCSVATTESYTDKAGTTVKNTTWHNVVFWGKLAQRADQELDKGSRIKIIGKLTNSNYEDANGNKRYETSVHVFDFNCIEKNN